MPSQGPDRRRCTALGRSGLCRFDVMRPSVVAGDPTSLAVTRRAASKETTASVCELQLASRRVSLEPLRVSTRSTKHNAPPARPPGILFAAGRFQKCTAPCCSARRKSRAFFLATPGELASPNGEFFLYFLGRRKPRRGVVYVAVERQRKWQKSGAGARGRGRVCAHLSKTYLAA